MVKLKYYTYGQYKRIMKLSDKDFTSMLLNGSLIYSHQNNSGIWYRDCGLGVYLKVS